MGSGESPLPSTTRASLASAPSTRLSNGSKLRSQLFINNYFVTQAVSDWASNYVRPSMESKNKDLTAKRETNNGRDDRDPLDFKTPDSVLHSTPNRVPKGFTITTDSYVSLCSRVYVAFCSQHPDFAESISESAFQYYATLLLWKRFADILQCPDRGGSVLRGELVNLFHYSNTSVPIPLRTYFRGIGHFRDPHSYERQFMLPICPLSEEIGGVAYTFGKVNAKTHAFYEAYPAPGIAALRMVADINYTNNRCKENLIWDLPPGLRPDEGTGELKPTKNLVGWAPAQCLTTDQLNMMESLKINDNFLRNSDISSAGNSVTKLCTGINRFFWHFNCYNDTKFGIASSLSLPSTGSVVQGIPIIKYPEPFEFDRSAMYCEGNLSVSSSYKVNDNLNKGAVISGYRMAKEPVGNRQCWCCYDFNNYAGVPKSWVCSRNDIYTFGSVGRLNEPVYTTGHISKRVLQNECIKHSMFESKEKWHIYM